jgi:alkylation response protein AidB-like acyl-CoA dehydrogenase
MKLFGATSSMRRAEIGIELAGPEAVTWPSGTTPTGQQIGDWSLHRQGIALGGGSNEIQRNIISERLLGMPREAAADREIPYRDVKRGPSAR